MKDVFEDFLEYCETQPPASANTDAIDQGLQYCPQPDCRSNLVYPEYWEERDRTSWNIQLCCPNCEHRRDVVADELEVQKYDEVLDAGTEQLEADLRDASRANMEPSVDRFIKALRIGAILPEDF